MLKVRNRVRQAYQEGRPSFGIYVTTASPRIIELLGFAGLDFVRIDMNGAAMNMETVENMIRAAHAVGVTPFVRVERNDEWHIAMALSMGALGIIVPQVAGPDDVRAAVRAAKTQPVGDRHAGPGGPTGGFGLMSVEDYLQWAEENIILSVQVETKSGVESIEEIVKVPGLDMVQSGRGDLSYSYGVPRQQYHPLVLEAERKAIEAGLRAGKMTSVQYYPMRDPAQVNMVREWIRRGVHCLSVGTDSDIVMAFRRLLSDLHS